MQQNPAQGAPQYQQNPMYQAAGTQRVSTNTPDTQYDLVSVLYHALEGAQQNHIACADRAKQLLGRRLGQSSLH